MTRQEYHIASIDLELYELKNYRKNLKRFALFEIRKHNMFAKKFYRILEEVERVTIEIYELENRKSEILNLNNY
jgi:hypothetical protein